MEAVTPSLFDLTRKWLEIAYFVSGISVAILVAIGLRQINLAKNQLETAKEIFRTQSRRAAAEAAVIECRRFAETIIQDRLLLDKFCSSHGITLFQKALISRTKDGFRVDLSGINKDDVDKLSDAADIINKLVNSMEAYSLFFLSGVADENIAFHTNGKAYIEMAEHIFKLFPTFNLDEDDAEPIKSLYFHWLKKYEAKRLKIEKKKIEGKLADYKDKNIKPIGT